MKVFLKARTFIPHIGFLLLLLLLGNPLTAQADEPVDYTLLLKKLERVLKKGNKRTLRDLGSLLDKPQLDAKVRKTLQHYCLFSDNEINLKKASRDEFLNFFYDQHRDIKYSEFFGAFYITPIEERPLTFDLPQPIEESENNRAIQTKNQIGLFIKAFKAKNTFSCIESINQLSKIKSKESIQFLQQQLSNQSIETAFSEDSPKVYIALIKAIENVPNYGAFRTILSLLKEEKVLFFEVEESLAKLTNILAPKELSGKETISFFESLTDSLFTLNAIRAHGYEQLFSFREHFFFDKVDYYGKIFCRSNNIPWITNNAVTDLLNTQHPRVLLYVASFIYKTRGIKSPLAKFDAIQCMENLTNIPIQLDINEPDTYEQFLFYWWQSYNNYEWNNKQGIFVNKEKKIARLDLYEKQFRRLNSKNDSVAFESYNLLCEGQSNEIIDLARKYRPLLRTINRNLPPLKSHFLESIVQLTSFYKENEIPYQIKEKNLVLLDYLSQTIEPNKRIKFENQLIKQLALDDLSGIEYYAILRVANRDLNLSVGRVLDYFYSQNWKTILDNPFQLRLYLKKAQLFNAIGASGICNFYLNKFDIGDTYQQEKLRYLSSIETDIGIKNQIAQIIIKDAPNDAIAQISTADFLQNPTTYNKIELQILPAPNEKQLKLIVNAIQAEENPDLIKQYFLYLSYHPSIEVVPTLFKLIDEDKIIIHNQENTLTVGERVVPILEDIYDYSFASTDTMIFETEEWKKLWRNNKKDYKDWGYLFLEQKLTRLQAKEELSIKELNNFIDLAQENEMLLHDCLGLLKRVTPTKDIRKLSLDKELSLQKHLSYFFDLGLSYKYLDDIPRLFKIDEKELIISFLEKESADFDPLDQGSFYNNLFQAKWFLEYVLSGQINTERVEFYTSILDNYLEESDYLSEFEEQRTLQNMTHLASIGKPLQEKLEAALALEADPKLKANILEGIIARIDYADIPVVIDYVPYLNYRFAHQTYEFLSKDFGLPIFQLDSLGVEKLKENHKKLSKFEFYQHYLEIFELDFHNAKGQLDLEKIYSLLEFEIVSPLVGQGGGKRDYFVYGLIKLLEIHFDTRLGFHEKLNESQTFYTFTSNKRARAWQAYVKDKELLSIQAIPTSSFNRTKSTE